MTAHKWHPTAYAGDERLWYVCTECTEPHLTQNPAAWEAAHPALGLADLTRRLEELEKRIDTLEVHIYAIVD